jgi:hypothetical protein
MTLATDSECFPTEFVIEDVTAGVHANGFGHISDGRSFAFFSRHNELVVEIYRPRLPGPVPHPEDVVAVATRRLTEIDVTDERSLVAAVRDAVTGAQPVR